MSDDKDPIEMADAWAIEMDRIDARATGNPRPEPDHVERAFRRGFEQGVAAALDASLERGLSRRTLCLWEQRVADWRNGQSEDYCPPECGPDLEDATCDS